MLRRPSVELCNDLRRHFLLPLVHFAAPHKLTVRLDQFVLFVQLHGLLVIHSRVSFHTREAQVLLQNLHLLLLQIFVQEFASFSDDRCKILKEEQNYCLFFSAILQICLV